MKANRKDVLKKTSLNKKQLYAKVASLEKELYEKNNVPSIEEITACIAAANIPRPTGDPPKPPTDNSDGKDSSKRKASDQSNDNSCYKAAALSVQAILKRHKS